MNAKQKAVIRAAKAVGVKRTVKDINDSRISAARRFVGQWIAANRGQSSSRDADPLINAMDRLLPGTPMNLFWNQFKIALYAADDSKFVFDQAYELLKVLNRFRSRAARPEME